MDISFNMSRLEIVSSLFPCLLSPRFQSCSKFSFVGIFLLFLGMLISFLTNWLVRLLFIIRMNPFQSFLFLLRYFSPRNWDGLGLSFALFLYIYSYSQKKVWNIVWLKIRTFLSIGSITTSHALLYSKNTL